MRGTAAASRRAAAHGKPLMYKLMAFMSRKPGISGEELRAHYESAHVRLIAEATPVMKGYRRNYVNRDEPFGRCAEQIDFDVVTEMEFDDRAECQRWFDAFRDPAVAARILADERSFLDTDRLRVCVVDVVATG